MYHESRHIFITTASNLMNSLITDNKLLRDTDKK